MAPQRQQAALFQQGRLELAVQAYQAGKFQSYRAAAKAFDVPRTMLQHCLDGIQQQLGSTPKNCLLTSTEEEILIQ
jgi:hypothetical protein